MEKSKVCFLIDDGIIRSHHGVRRYILSLSDILSSSYECEIFVAKRHVSGRFINWNKLYFQKVDYRDNGFKENRLVGRNKREIISNIPVALQHSEAFSGSEIASINFGCNLPDSYEFAIVCAPWLLTADLLLPKARKTFCIAYDAIPNIYSIKRPGDVGLANFASEHARGYQIAETELDGILAISEDSKIQCESIGFGRIKEISVIPPFLPAGFSGLSPKSADKKKRIVLAAPFDLRKGLEAIPDLVNASGAESLVIFGSVRCDIGKVYEFYDRLSMDNVEWWSSVSYDKQIELYTNSHLLLFPSLNEGLGLPVLEAYACGTSVLVSNISPLNKIALKEDVLNDDLDASKAKIADRISSNADHSFLAKHADKTWGRANLEAVWGTF